MTNSTRAERPNIVLIVSDDHGREALGCYGNPAVQTPNLDALASDGVRFTNAFCTSASCSPSRAVLLTGLYSHANGMYGLAHSYHHFICFDTVRTLPAMLAEGGYRTGRVGKKHYAPDRLFPFEWNPPENQFGRDDVRMAEACRDFIRGPEPFFLYWCSFNPHRARPLEEHPLRPDTFGNPPQSFPGDRETPFEESAVIVPPFLSDLPEVRAELAQYYQSIARLDRGIGRLLSILEETGKRSRTIVIYLSDNGAAFPGAKTTLYEPGMALPCIVCNPFLPTRGTTCDALMTWADITPTILDFAGMRLPESGFHGRSFAPILHETSPIGWREEVFAAHNFHEITNYYPMRVVRSKRYKFIWNIAWKLDYSFAGDLWKSASWRAVVRDGAERLGVRTVEAYLHRPQFELYDLETDPNEVNNLAQEPAYQPLVQSFIEKLKDFQRQTKDPWLHKWTYE